MTSLISGCAETSANFAGGQTLRSGGLCSMRAVRQSPAEIRLLGTTFKETPPPSTGLLFCQGANDVSRRELVNDGFLGA